MDSKTESVTDSQTEICEHTQKRGEVHTVTATDGQTDGETAHRLNNLT